MVTTPPEKQSQLGSPTRTPRGKSHNHHHTASSGIRPPTALATPSRLPTTILSSANRPQPRPSATRSSSSATNNNNQASLVSAPSLSSSSHTANAPASASQTPHRCVTSPAPKGSLKSSIRSPVIRVSSSSPSSPSSPSPSAQAPPVAAASSLKHQPHVKRASQAQSHSPKSSSGLSSPKQRHQNASTLAGQRSATTVVKRQSVAPQPAPTIKGIGSPRQKGLERPGDAGSACSARSTTIGSMGKASKRTTLPPQPSLPRGSANRPLYLARPSPTCSAPMAKETKRSAVGCSGQGCIPATPTPATSRLPASTRGVVPTLPDGRNGSLGSTTRVTHRVVTAKPNLARSGSRKGLPPTLTAPSKFGAEKRPKSRERSRNDADAGAASSLSSDGAGPVKKPGVELRNQLALAPGVPHAEVAEESPVVTNISYEPQLADNKSPLHSAHTPSTSSHESIEYFKDRFQEKIAKLKLVFANEQMIKESRYIQLKREFEETTRQQSAEIECLQRVVDQVGIMEMGSPGSVGEGASLGSCDVTKLQVVLEDSNRDMQHASSRFESTLEAMQKRHQEALEDFIPRLDIPASSMDQSEHKLRRLVEHHQKEIEFIRQQHKDQIDSLTNNYNKLADFWQTTVDSREKVARVEQIAGETGDVGNASLSMKVAELQAGLETVSERTAIVVRNQVEREVRSKVMEAVVQMVGGDQDISHLKAAFSKQIEQLQDNHIREIKRLNDLRQKEIQRLKELLCSSITSAIASATTQPVTASTADRQGETPPYQDGRQFDLAKIENLQQEHLRQMEELNRQREDDLANLRSSMAAEHKAHLESMMLNVEAEIRAKILLEEKPKGATATGGTEDDSGMISLDDVEGLQHAHLRQMEMVLVKNQAELEQNRQSMKLAYEDQIKLLQTQLQHSAHNTKLISMSKHRDLTLNSRSEQQSRKEYAAELAEDLDLTEDFEEARAAYASRVADLQEQHATILEKLAQDHSNEIANLRGQLEEEHAKELQGVRECYERLKLQHPSTGWEASPRLGPFESSPASGSEGTQAGEIDLGAVSGDKARNLVLLRANQGERLRIAATHQSDADFERLRRLYETQLGDHLRAQLGMKNENRRRHRTPEGEQRVGTGTSFWLPKGDQLRYQFAEEMKELKMRIDGLLTDHLHRRDSGPQLSVASQFHSLFVGYIDEMRSLFEIQLENLAVEAQTVFEAHRREASAEYEARLAAETAIMQSRMAESSLASSATPGFEIQYKITSLREQFNREKELLRTQLQVAHANQVRYLEGKHLKHLAVMRKADAESHRRTLMKLGSQWEARIKEQASLSAVEYEQQALATAISSINTEHEEGQLKRKCLRLLEPIFAKHAQDLNALRLLKDQELDKQEHRLRDQHAYDIAVLKIVMGKEEAAKAMIDFSEIPFQGRSSHEVHANYARILAAVKAKQAESLARLDRVRISQVQTLLDCWDSDKRDYAAQLRLHLETEIRAAVFTETADAIEPLLTKDNYNHMKDQLSRLRTEFHDELQLVAKARDARIAKLEVDLKEQRIRALRLAPGIMAEPDSQAATSYRQRPARDTGLHTTDLEGVGLNSLEVMRQRRLREIKELKELHENDIKTLRKDFEHCCSERLAFAEAQLAYRSGENASGSFNQIQTHFPEQVAGIEADHAAQINQLQMVHEVQLKLIRDTLREEYEARLEGLKSILESKLESSLMKDLRETIKSEQRGNDSEGLIRELERLQEVHSSRLARLSRAHRREMGALRQWLLEEGQVQVTNLRCKLEHEIRQAVATELQSALKPVSATQGSLLALVAKIATQREAFARKTCQLEDVMSGQTRHLEEQLEIKRKQLEMVERSHRRLDPNPFSSLIEEEAARPSEERLFLEYESKLTQMRVAHELEAQRLRGELKHCPDVGDHFQCEARVSVARGKNLQSSACGAPHSELDCLETSEKSGHAVSSSALLLAALTGTRESRVSSASNTSDTEEQSPLGMKDDDSVGSKCSSVFSKGELQQKDSAIAKSEPGGAVEHSRTTVKEIKSAIELDPTRRISRMEVAEIASSNVEALRASLESRASEREGDIRQEVKPSKDTLRGLKDGHNAEIRQMRERYEAQLGILLDQMSDHTADGLTPDEIQRIKDQHAAQVSALEAYKNREISELKSKLRDSVSAAKDELEKSRRDIEEQASRLRDERDRANAEFESRISLLRKQYEDRLVACREEVASIRVLHDESTTAKQGEIEALVAELADRESQLKELDEQRQGLFQNMESMSKLHEDELQQLNARLQHETEGLKSQIRHVQADLEKAQEESMRQFDGAMVIQEYAQKIATLENDLAIEIEARNSEIQEHEKRMTIMSRSVKELEETLKNQIAVSVADAESQGSELRRRLSLQEAEIERLTAEKLNLENAFIQIQSEYWGLKTEGTKRSHGTSENGLSCNSKASSPVLRRSSLPGQTQGRPDTPEPLEDLLEGSQGVLVDDSEEELGDEILLTAIDQARSSIRLPRQQDDDAGSLVSDTNEGNTDVDDEPITPTVGRLEATQRLSAMLDDTGSETETLSVDLDLIQKDEAHVDSCSPEGSEANLNVSEDESHTEAEFSPMSEETKSPRKAVSLNAFSETEGANGELDLTRAKEIDDDSLLDAADERSLSDSGPVDAGSGSRQGGFSPDRQGSRAGNQVAVNLRTEREDVEADPPSPEQDANPAENDGDDISASDVSIGDISEASDSKLAIPSNPCLDRFEDGRALMRSTEGSVPSDVHLEVTQHSNTHKSGDHCCLEEAGPSARCRGRASVSRSCNADRLSRSQQCFAGLDDHDMGAVLLSTEVEHSPAFKAVQATDTNASQERLGEVPCNGSLPTESDSQVESIDAGGEGVSSLREQKDLEARTGPE